MNKRMLTALALTGAALAFGGCANSPPAEPAIATATASVDAARSSGASEMAAVEINNARSKLDRSRALAQAGDSRGAIRLAEEADIDAQLARAKAGSERARRAVAELDASLQALREELNRNGANPPSTVPQAMPMPAR